MPSDVDFMRLALDEAMLAQVRGEVPVGAVIVKNDQIIARAGNFPIGLHDPSAHAEMLALRAAGNALQNYRLDDTVLYVTLEPCLMCAAAMVHARVRRVVFGAFDPKAGAAGGMLDAFALKGLNHRVDVFGGVLEADCAALLSVFFANAR
jgi:tRNA(adenine34) deaminase